MDRRLHIAGITGPAVVIGVAAVVSIVTSATVVASAYRARGAETVRREETISVKGSTRQRVTSDRAVWRIGLHAGAPELKSAYQALEAGVAAVRAFLLEQGFSDEHLNLKAIDTATHFVRDSRGNETRDISGYSLSREFTLTSDDVHRVSAAAAGVTELIERGILVASRPPEFFYTKLPDLRIDLMAAAARDARARASRIADASGCALGGVRSASMGVLQVTQPNSTEVASYGLYDTSTIEKDVTAVVSVTYGVSR